MSNKGEMISAMFSKTLFGNTVPDFRGWAPTGVTGQENVFQRDTAKLLKLDAGFFLANDIPPLVTGNWVISTDGFPTWPTDAEIAGIAARPAFPLLAVVDYSCGGGSINVEMDVIPGNVISVPGMTCEVNVRWGDLPDYGLNPSATLISDSVSLNSGGPMTLPKSTTVTATANRSSASAFFGASRTIYMPSRFAGSGNTYTVTYRIPNLARRFRVWDFPSTPSGLYSAGATYTIRNLLADAAPAGSRSRVMTGADVLALNEAGVVIPSCSTYLTISVPPGTAIGSNSSGSRSIPLLEFSLNL
jgi:hypothetical protein